MTPGGYSASGKCDLPRLAGGGMAGVVALGILEGVLACVPCAGALGWVLAPMILGAASRGTGYLVHWSHVRSVTLGAMLGIASAVVGALVVRWAIAGGALPWWPAAVLLSLAGIVAAYEGAAAASEPYCEGCHSYLASRGRFFGIRSPGELEGAIEKADLAALLGSLEGPGQKDRVGLHVTACPRCLDQPRWLAVTIAKAEQGEIAAKAATAFEVDASEQKTIEDFLAQGGRAAAAAGLGKGPWHLFPRGLVAENGDLLGPVHAAAGSSQSCFQLLGCLGIIIAVSAVLSQGGELALLAGLGAMTMTVLAVVFMPWRSLRVGEANGPPGVSTSLRHPLPVGGHHV